MWGRYNSPKVISGKFHSNSAAYLETEELEFRCSDDHFELGLRK